MTHSRHKLVHKGRGAVSNPAGRFERNSHEVFDDGWDSIEELPESPPTQLRPDPARRIISRNQSPDIPFSASINPYRGCEHGCVYCLDADTPILLADGRYKPIGQIRTGDSIVGTRRERWYRRYCLTTVLAHWFTRKPAYRITLADGTQLTASADHRFLTERGWKHVTGTEHGRDRRPHLTVNNKLMGTGAYAASPEKGDRYRRGYLCGMIRGDGHLGTYHYEREGRAHGDVHRFRLALCDRDALQQTREYLICFDVETREFIFQPARGTRRVMYAIRTSAASSVATITKLVAWPAAPDSQWMCGYLAGLFDAEGHYANGILRISNSDANIVEHATQAMRHLNLRYRLEPIERENRKPLKVIRLLGGLQAALKLFHRCDPVIRRKTTVSNMAVKSQANLHIVAIEPLGQQRTMCDITTGTGDFLANGVISHNCFARPSHSFLDLSPGLDFESKIFFKENAAEKLEAELRKPGYRPTPISLGINTDAYQPVERRLQITRSLLEVLLRYRHPVSLLTKSTLIQRDLDLLGEMAHYNLVCAAVSLTSLDPAVKRGLEPRTASPAGRLRTIAALAQAGVPTGVMTAPVIPAITDHELEAMLEASANAGATLAGYVLLRLPWELKEVFRDWLAEHYPQRAAHVMSLIRQSRGGKDYDSSWGTRATGTGQFAELLAQRFRLACKRYGLNSVSRTTLDCSQFRVPPKPGDQLSLLS